MPTSRQRVVAHPADDATECRWSVTSFTAAQPSGGNARYIDRRREGVIPGRLNRCARVSTFSPGSSLRRQRSAAGSRDCPRAPDGSSATRSPASDANTFGKALPVWLRGFRRVEPTFLRRTRNSGLADTRTPRGSERGRRPPQPEGRARRSQDCAGIEAGASCVEAFAHVGVPVRRGTHLQAGNAGGTCRRSMRSRSPPPPFPHQARREPRRSPARRVPTPRRESVGSSRSPRARPAAAPGSA